MNALLIGFGNIGFRHFQAMLSNDQILKITIIDQNIETSLKLNSIETEKKITFLKSISEINHTHFDFVVFALPSDVMMRELNQIKNIHADFALFEKPFAQSKKNYQELTDQIQKCFKYNHINCQRNAWQGYHFIRDIVQISDASVHVEVSGNQWGLGCNAVHFIEIFKLITNSTDLEVISSVIEKTNLTNKRGVQYEDFNGTIGIKNEKGNTLQITSGNVSDQIGNVFLTVYLNQMPKYLIDDEAGIVFDFEKKIFHEFPKAYVSSTTAALIDAVKEHKKIFHPSVLEAKSSHFALFTALENALERTEFNIT